MLVLVPVGGCFLNRLLDLIHPFAVRRKPAFRFGQKRHPVGNRSPVLAGGQGVAGGRDTPTTVKIGIGVAPLLRRFAEQGHAQQIGLTRINHSCLCRNGKFTLSK